MHMVRKCLKLSPTKALPASTPPPLGKAHSRGSPAASHNAMLSPLAPLEAGVVEEEEEEGYLLVEEDTTDSSLVITMEDSQYDSKARRRGAAQRKRRLREREDTGVSESEEEEEEEEEEEAGAELEIDRQLDHSLETTSKQHNLTKVNVRNILHEVITNEHVVAMMKAAINETEAVPPFEPKMTRSKFKEVVEKGVVIPTWNISPIKKTTEVKAPQFVDIPLAEEDSSDEEYHPNEEDEDETAEDTFQESDMESTASSPRGSRVFRPEEDSCSPWQSARHRPRCQRTRSVSMGPPQAPPPKAVTDSSFLEKLHAVEEELAVMEPYQPVSEEEGGSSVMACRTRSKRPLRDVPLGRLEAELCAPDATPDMYDSAHEDRDWTDWLRGLMSSDMENEEECDDEDDPEYNFLADTDEPDVEDYRDDKAVRITKKEVNQLMEELFETLKEDLAGQDNDDEGHEEEEETLLHTTQENTSVVLAESDDEPITELRTVKQQLAVIRRRGRHGLPIYPHAPEPATLQLDLRQKSWLQQQLQQHVQLLTQVHLLSSPVAKLQSEADTTRQFLFELNMLAQRGEMVNGSIRPGFSSAFRASNLQGALQLLEEMQKAPISYQPKNRQPNVLGRMRCHPVIPAELAWLFATRPVFLYPELLPCASLDPALYCTRRIFAFTAAEDCLLVLGLRNMEGTCDPPRLVSQFLLRKTLAQVRRRILECCKPGAPDNIVKAYRYQRVVWPMPVACRRVNPQDQRPPVEKEEGILPAWLARSRPVIHLSVSRYNAPADSAPRPVAACKLTRPRRSHRTFLRAGCPAAGFPPGTRYPPRLPADLDFQRIGFVMIQQPTPTPASPAAPPPPPPPPPAAPTDPSLLREQISRRYRTFAGLRRLPGPPRPARPPSPPSGTRGGEERLEVGGRGDQGGGLQMCLLRLSDTSSPRSTESSPEGEMTSPSGGGRGEEGGEMSSPSRGGREGRGEEGAEKNRTEERGSAMGRQEEEDDDDEDPQREAEDLLFAQDYLCRVCEAVLTVPSRALRLLEELQGFEAREQAQPVELYGGLCRVLQPWPQLLRDYAAFLTRPQAQHCGLLAEQQQFERSRRFLWKLGRCLGKDSVPYQQVVSVLQGGPAPGPADITKISSVLHDHTHLHKEFWKFFIDLAQPQAGPHHLEATEENCLNNAGAEEGLSGAEMREAPPVCAKNISLTPNGEKVVVWTREADRTILTTCQQKGANQETFLLIASQLGNKTVKQVITRFQELMSLFRSATQKSSSCSIKDKLVINQRALPD